jgi:hypothetical protein
MYPHHCHHYCKKEDGFEFYTRMKHTFVNELHTPIETFNEAASYHKKVILEYYKEEISEDLLYAVINTWFLLQLRHKTSKIIHLAATVPADNNNTNRLRCLLCDNSNPQYVAHYTNTTSSKVFYYFACQRHHVIDNNAILKNIISYLIK